MRCVRVLIAVRGGARERFTQAKTSLAFGTRSQLEANKIMGIIPIVRDAYAET